MFMFANSMDGVHSIRIFTYISLCIFYFLFFLCFASFMSQHEWANIFPFLTFVKYLQFHFHHFCFSFFCALCLRSPVNSPTFFPQLSSCNRKKKTKKNSLCFHFIVSHFSLNIIWCLDIISFSTNSGFTHCAHELWVRFTNRCELQHWYIVDWISFSVSLITRLRFFLLFHRTDILLSFFFLFFILVQSNVILCLQLNLKALKKISKRSYFVLAPDNLLKNFANETVKKKVQLKMKINIKQTI